MRPSVCSTLHGLSHGRTPFSRSATIFDVTRVQISVRGALVIDVAMSLSLGLRCTQRCAAPLAVGETGGSKGMGENREGDHPFCTSSCAEARGYAVSGAPKRTHPSAREGQSSLALSWLFRPHTSRCTVRLSVCGRERRSQSAPCVEARWLSRRRDSENPQGLNFPDRRFRSNANRFPDVLVLGRGDFRRRTATNLRHQHLGDVLHREGQPKPAPAPLCNDQRSDPEFHRWPRANAGRKRDSRERRGAGPGLDAHPFDNARGESHPFRRADETAGPATRAGAGVLLASDEASYISGATVAVTGGKPII